MAAAHLSIDAKWAAATATTTGHSESSSRFTSDGSTGSSSPDELDSETTAPPSVESVESLRDTKVVAPAPHLGALQDEASDGNVLKHAEFGWDANPEYRYTSQHLPGVPLPRPDEDEPSYSVVLLTYVSYIVLIAVGHLRDYFGKRMFPSQYKHLMQSNGYAALNSDFDSFYTRRLKTRLDDCFSRPVTGVCGRTVVCYDRVTPDYNHTFQLTGGKTRALNISGYNYLGFAQSQGGCSDNVKTVLENYSVSSMGSRLGAGYLDLQQQAEKLVARFLGTEDAMVVSMGFATNSTSIPAIASPGTLIISDEFNHSSIRFGARLSRAHIRQYKHNNMAQLESLLRECISQGMPRTHRPWKKIVVIVEGLYSMEGTLVNLPELMRLKKKYKFHLYIDEAHSVGAIGPRGRGVCDYFGVDPRKVDILMGTFTKSFGAAGGYIGGSKTVIDRIRLMNHSNVYGETLSPPVMTQIIVSMASIMGVGNDPEEAALLPSWVQLPRTLADGSEGLERLRRLAFNSRYLSTGLRKLGFIVFGHRDSPIVPLLLYLPGKMGLFSRMMLDRNMALPPDERLIRQEEDLGDEEMKALEDPASPWALSGRARPPIVVVVVAYPATPLISSRVRFCVSAAHTKKDIDDVLIACNEVGALLDLKYYNGGPGGRWTIEQVLSRSTELVAWDGKTPI
ncbi:serine palmitoyltransferase component [Tilletia horrida]|uniref:serine C-palmitoyltransferase n=1 Tax=Tilletia horrida TaxID=155126 RepID=A0AAN6GL54_9BASI|nr:serine palmitoyltransferase component [Tilletia horrida]KAK0542600.1 serine palmitoyltransferase component [Tilletia horrida]KAK0559510.1 serine palmitoyltransferase component [Tilletia horrida]